MKKFVCFLMIVALLFSLCACGSPDMTTHIAPEAAPNAEDTKLSFMAEFYKNDGVQWLAVEGTSFDISPNKVKEYSYDSDGFWISTWTMSSVMSVTIDGKHIDSCGSTILFYDTQLDKIDIELPSDVTLSEGDSATINSPDDLRFGDSWRLHHWWITKNQSNTTAAARIVVIQSQEGDPICMFMGNNVTWEVSRNLPKTTEICIDGRMVYIHRANFSIIDTAIFE